MSRPAVAADDGNLRHCVHYADWGDDGPEMVCANCYADGRWRERRERAEYTGDGSRRRGRGPR